MTKFYVESGPNFQVTLTANSPIHAILKALAAGDPDETLELADVFIVNERGFVWERPEHELYGDEKVYPTRLLLGQPAE